MEQKSHVDLQKVKLPLMIPLAMAVGKRTYANRVIGNDRKKKRGGGMTRRRRSMGR